MKRRALAIAIGFALLTGGEIWLFLWLNGAEIAARRADAFLRDGAYASAAALYQQALRRGPDRADLLAKLARALAGVGRLVEAREAIARALVLSPGHPEARQLALELAWKANDRRAVIDAATALLAGDPNNVMVRRDLARALAAEGRSGEAEDEYRRVLEAAPSEVSAMAELAALLQARGEMSGAIEQRRRALAAAPGDGRLELDLAGHLAASGRFADAAELYERYLARVPDDRDARLRLADVLNGMQAFDRAAAEYRAVLGRSPDDAEIRLKLARTLSWSKRYEESIQEYRRLLSEP
jgi:tetratricopeptide (TPR) repeat protein